MISFHTASSVNTRDLEIRILESRRFDADHRPLEPRKVAVTAKGGSSPGFVIDVDEWAALRDRIDEALS